MAILDKIDEVVGELTTWSYSTILTVPDPAVASGVRFPLLTELSAAELSVFLVDTGAYITAWTFGAGTWAVGAEMLKNVDVKNVGRGNYVQATGKLTITVHAGDNPIVAVGSAVGSKEKHEALLTVRYNADVDQLHKRVQFTVEDLGKVPRVP